MTLPKSFPIKESISELRKIQNQNIPMIANRVKVLIEFKKHEKVGISKRAVADNTGMNHNSVQAYRNMYINGGLESLLSYQKHEGRPSILTPEEHLRVEARFKDPQNGLRGYVELQDWIEMEFGKTIKYNTILKYSIRNFQLSVKVARKSHLKKDEEKVNTFKKTSVKSSKK